MKCVNCRGKVVEAKEENKHDKQLTYACDTCGLWYKQKEIIE